MILGEAPGRLEDEQGEVFVGQSGRMLDNNLGAVGITDYYVTNAVKCRPPENRTPKRKEIAACNHWLSDEFNRVKPKYVLILGNVALEAMLGVKGIRKYRGKPIEDDGVIYLPTYHPAAILRDPELGPIFQRDLEVFSEVIQFGGVPYERGINPRVINTPEVFEEFLLDLKGLVSGDCETSGLYPWEKDAHIVTAGFGTANYQWILPIQADAWQFPWTQRQLRDMFERIAERLEDCIIVGHNWKFDALWLWVHGGIHIDADFDTMLAHYLINENALHSLDHLAKVYFGARNWDVPLKLKQGKEGRFEDHVRYLAQDLYYTRNLKKPLEEELRQDGDVHRVFKKIMMPCSAMFTEAEHGGCFIDTSRMDEVETLLRADMQRAVDNLDKWAHPKWDELWNRKTQSYDPINWGSPKQLGRLLFEDLKIPPVEKTKTGANSTSESVLNRIDHPMVRDLIDFRGAKQQLSFFIEGWKPYLHNHRLHPSFKLAGTVTGRLSCEHPNFQQIPRDPKIRSLITAPEGWEIVEADLSQIELRIAAELSGDRQLVYAYNHGIDVHWLTAIREIQRGGGMADEVIGTASVAVQRKVTYSEGIKILLEIGPDAAADIDSVWKELRKKAKAINFGYLYGMWWKKFKIYARDNYGVDVTDEQAQDSREAFFETYSDLPDWHKRQKRFAALNGYVRTISGRKRRLPDAQQRFDKMRQQEAERQAVNSPVQSFANELNLMSALQIRREFPRSQVRLIATVHDACLFEVKKECVPRVSRRILEIMSHPAMLDEFEIKLSVPIEADLKVGPWGKGISLKRWMEKNNVQG